MGTFSTLRTVALLVTLAVAASAHADTTLLREWARNKPRIVISFSGSDARAAADALRDTLIASPDWGKRRAEDVTVCSASEAPAIWSARGPQTTVVQLLSGRDGAPTPESLERLTIDRSLIGTRWSAVAAVGESTKAGELTFRLSAYAPDAPRLRRLVETLLERRADNYRTLPFEARFQTNRLAVLSVPALRTDAERWGERKTTGVWDEVLWRPLNERASLTPKELEERTLVYFVERTGAPDSAAPTEAAETLAPLQPLGPTAVAVAQRTAAHGEPVFVVSAPSVRVLRTRLSQFRNTDDLVAAAGKSRALPDLTRIPTAPLLVVIANPQAVAERTESLYATVSRDLSALGVAVGQRTPEQTRTEAELGALVARGAQDTLVRESPTRFVWVLTIADLAGRTTYRAVDRKITAEPTPFTEEQPERPRKKRNESDGDYEKRVLRYNDDFAKWDRRRKTWQDTFANASCEWQQVVGALSVAHARGRFQLIDTRAPGGPQALFSTECSGDIEDVRVHREQKVRVRGHGSRPDPLPVPVATADCPPELTAATLRRTAASALYALESEAVLPEAGLTLPAATTNPSAPPTARTPKVAEVVDGLVALTVGAADGVKVGDRFEVWIEFRETKDPETGRVLRTRVLESATVVVKSVEKGLCDAAPATPADVAKLKKIQPGMSARKL